MQAEKKAAQDAQKKTSKFFFFFTGADGGVGWSGGGEMRGVVLISPKASNLSLEGPQQWRSGRGHLYEENVTFVPQTLHGAPQQTNRAPQQLL